MSKGSTLMEIKATWVIFRYIPAICNLKIIISILIILSISKFNIIFIFVTYLKKFDYFDFFISRL